LRRVVGPERRQRRRVDVREEAPRIIIVCEGEETERLYFSAFRLPTVSVVGTGFNTVSLVRDAIERKAAGQFDRTWCVFDKDDYATAQFEAAIKLARDNDIHAAYSNEAFELWYLLHYGYYDSATSRAEYPRKLKSRLRHKYEKNDPNLYAELLAYQADAIRNAQRLLESYDPHMPHNGNPCTTVHLLVQELNELAQKRQ
jgi:hypothetical protein